MLKLNSMKKLLAILLTFISLIFMPACKEANAITVYAPDGAPALSLVKAIESANEFEYNIVGADVIQTVVSGDKKADICILPINLASKIIGSGNDYKMLGVVTHGNFYFASKNETNINRQTVGELVGKTVGVVQLQSIAGLTLKASLSSLGVLYNELTGGAEKSQTAINLLPITPNEIGTAEVDVYLAPSPAVDVKSKVFNLSVVGSLKELYGENGFPQAIIVCKNTVLENNLTAVKNLISKIKGVESYLLEKDVSEICSVVNSRLESGLSPSFNVNNLTKNSIINSSINFVSSKDCKGEVDEFISKIQAVSKGAVNTLFADFYYLENI